MRHVRRTAPCTSIKGKEHIFPFIPVKITEIKIDLAGHYLLKRYGFDTLTAPERLRKQLGMACQGCVHLGIVGVEVDALDRVGGLPLVQLIIGRLIGCHKRNSSFSFSLLLGEGGWPQARRMRGRLSYLARPDKACQLSPHPPQCAHWGTCPYPLCPFGTTSLPLLAFGHFPLTGGIGPLTGGISPLTRGVGPLWGECFGAVQIGRDSFFCRTFGYIYWELWRSAPVGGGRPGVPLLQERGREPAPSSAPVCALGHLPPRGKA